MPIRLLQKATAHAPVRHHVSRPPPQIRRALARMHRKNAHPVTQSDPNPRGCCCSWCTTAQRVQRVLCPYPKEDTPRATWLLWGPLAHSTHPNTEGTPSAERDTHGHAMTQLTQRTCTRCCYQQSKTPTRQLHALSEHTSQNQYRRTHAHCCRSNGHLKTSRKRRKPAVRRHIRSKQNTIILSTAACLSSG